MTVTWALTANEAAATSRVPLKQVHRIIKAELEGNLAELGAARAMVATDPDVIGGAPCFAGTRIPVHDVAELLSRGEAVKELLRASPALDERRIRLASVYAAAYPRCGRPPTPPWRASEPLSSETVRLDDLPLA